jgi:hypothetical protein
MLKIVGIQRGQSAAEELVLLQNQGVLKVTLRGHAILDEIALEEGLYYEPCRVHVFQEDVRIPAGCYVLLVTGNGENGWFKSADGSLIYVTHRGLPTPVWSSSTTLHLLAPTHCRKSEANKALLLV